MIFNQIFSRIESLVDSTETVEDTLPCKSDILSLRECRKGDKAVRIIILDLPADCVMTF